MPSDEETDINLITITIMGDTKVGKTALSNSFLKSQFFEEYSPTIFDRSETLYRLSENILLEVAVQDTGGSKTSIDLEDFWLQWMNETDAFILVYDTTNPSSLKHLEKLVTKIKQAKGADPLQPMDYPFFPIKLVGTKSDLKNQVSLDEIQSFGKFHLGITDTKDVSKWHVQTNAKECEMTDNLFKNAITNGRNYKRQIARRSPKKMNISIPKTQTQRGRKSFMFNSPKTPIYE
eukprot:gene869-9118_t